MSLTELRELPNNEEAERSLIGLTLVKGQIPPAAKVLATTDFYSPNYRDAWAAFLELEADGREIDPLTAYEIMKRERPGIEHSFPMPSLTATTLGMPNTSEKKFVDLIRNASVRRFLIKKLGDGIGALAAGEKDVIRDLKRELGELEFAEETTGHFRSLEDIIDREVKPALQDLHKGITHRISTGFDAIDKSIGGGLSLSDILLVAALPGSGKSAFVLQTAANIAKQGYPVAFLSGEMTDRENGLRLLSQLSRSHNLNSVTHITEIELQFLTDWAEAIKGLPIYFDSRTYDLRSVSAAMRSLVEEKGVKVLVIDYIQLLKLAKADKTKRTERITEASQEVKRLAMEYGIAVIEVAQFNREGAKSNRPTMHDLDGSSQLEKDTSLIFIIDRSEANPAEITIRIEKGRNTGKSEICGFFEGWRLGFDF